MTRPNTTQPRYAPFAPTIKERSITALTLILMVGLFATAGGIMAYYFLLNPDILLDAKNRHAPIATKKILKVSRATFHIPDYLIRKVRHTPLRKIKTISLVIPMGWRPSSSPVQFRHANDLQDWILADIEKSTATLTHKKWLTDIYRLYRAGPAISHSSGLFRYHFLSDSPYESLELFTDDLQNPTLFIKCDLQSSTLGTRLCERTLPISDRIQIRYRFSRLKLAGWRQMDLTIQSLIKASYRPSKN